MNETLFWTLIERSRSEEDQIAWLQQALGGETPEHIVAFEEIRCRLLRRAASFPVLAANFVLVSYVSDDTFEDFRHWLILQGQERFEGAVEDPETIADWLTDPDPDEMTGEPLMYVAAKAYEPHGDEDDFHGKVRSEPDPEFEMPWPESKQEYAERFPRLVANFWNQERIEELH